jgi:pyruvate dehydrogenase E1 component alpha subunit
MASLTKLSPESRKSILAKIGKENLREILKQMLLIRHLETRAEAAYQQGKIGGFFHAYTGQEAIQTAAVEAIGPNNWWSTSYRCHALAILLGATPNEIMAEFYGRSTGNAKGRGGSMHLYTDRLLGGYGIVGGQIPIATGAAFTLKYLQKDDEVSICFFGEGAVAQGSFHESLNLASLWSLPCIYVIENNKWGMGTSVKRALVNENIAEEQAASYKMKGYTFDGMDFVECYAAFQMLHQEVMKTKKPVLVEFLTERFKGHSVSDPALYRTKDQLKECLDRDPIVLMQNDLLEAKFITEEEIKALDKACKEIIVAAMKYAEDSPWPDPSVLGEDVLAPETEEGIL